MRVLVCGGRDLDSTDVWNWLERHMHEDVGRPTMLIHGGARGADEGAARWGESEHCLVRCYPANWKSHGKAAGPIRNQQMIDQGRPDIVVAFPGGRGTADMVSRARAHGIRVHTVDISPTNRKP